MRHTVALLTILVAGIGGGVALDRLVLRPDPIPIIAQGVIDALAKRNRKARAAYHAERNRLQAEQIDREARARRNERISRRWKQKQFEVERAAQKKIEEIEASVRLPVSVVEVITVPDEADRQKLKDYTRDAERAISAVTKQRDLYQNLWRRERALTIQLEDTVKSLQAVENVLRRRAILSENRVRALEGRKFRWGPGATVGATHGVAPGSGWKAGAAIGITVIWG